MPNNPFQPAAQAVIDTVCDGNTCEADGKRVGWDPHPDWYSDGIPHSESHPDQSLCRAGRAGGPRGAHPGVSNSRGRAGSSGRTGVADADRARRRRALGGGKVPAGARARGRCPRCRPRSRQPLARAPRPPSGARPSRARTPEERARSPLAPSTRRSARFAVIATLRSAPNAISVAAPGYRAIGSFSGASVRAVPSCATTRTVRRTASRGPARRGSVAARRAPASPERFATLTRARGRMRPPPRETASARRAALWESLGRNGGSSASPAWERQ
jgi:hypothetical protein